MEKLVFLGSSAALPTLKAHNSSTAIVKRNKKIWLVDCGDGIQFQVRLINNNDKSTKEFLKVIII